MIVFDPCMIVFDLCMIVFDFIKITKMAVFGFIFENRTIGSRCLRPALFANLSFIKNVMS